MHDTPTEPDLLPANEPLHPRPQLPASHTFDTALEGGTMKDGVVIRVQQRVVRRNGKGAEGLGGSGQPR